MRLKQRCPNGHVVSEGSICPACFSNVDPQRRTAVRVLRGAPYAGLRLVGALLGVVAVAMLFIGVHLLPWMEIDLSPAFLGEPCVGLAESSVFDRGLSCDDGSPTLTLLRIDVSEVLRDPEPHPFGWATEWFVDWGAMATAVIAGAVTLSALFRRRDWIGPGFVSMAGGLWAVWVTTMFARRMPITDIGIGLYVTVLSLAALGAASYLTSLRPRRPGLPTR